MYKLFLFYVLGSYYLDDQFYNRFIQKSLTIVCTLLTVDKATNLINFYLLFEFCFSSILVDNKYYRLLLY